MADVYFLDVLLYGEPIGTLTRFGDDRTLFAFNDAYVADDHRPVLGLGFRDERGGLVTSLRPYRERVMPFFSNLLPEGPMRAYLAGRAGVNPERELSLLWALGPDLPGAIVIQPGDGEPWPRDADPDRARGNAAREDRALRFSLAGVQLKLPASHDARGGWAIPPGGVGGSWIIKLPAREFPGMPENELSMMTLARWIGMDVPPVRLVDVDAIRDLPADIGSPGGRALAVQRFDRRPDRGAVHIEDFAQVFGRFPEDKYKKVRVRHIARVIARQAGEADSAELVRRLTFNMLIGNADMHAKNWSLIYPDRRTAALAPAYDFVSTIAYQRHRSTALRVSRSKRFDEFSEAELTHLASRAGLPGELVLDTARETVALFHQYWQAEKAHLPVHGDVVRAIDEHLKTVPIA